MVGRRLAMNPQPLEVWTDRASWPIALDIHDDPANPSGWLAEELPISAALYVVARQCHLERGIRMRSRCSIDRNPGRNRPKEAHSCWMKNLEQNNFPHCQR